MTKKEKEQLKQLNRLKKDYIKIAKELFYSDQCIENIQKAENEIQIQRCLITERERKENSSEN